jgi:hypothetical protein
MPMGNVVVHSDPRLAVLLKRNPTAAPPITPIHGGDESAKKSHSASKTTTSKTVKEEVKSAAKNQLPGAPTHQLPDAKPGHEVASVKTAPVHAFVTPSHKDGRIVYAGKGFRVQIYNGNDREKAIKVKTEFMRHFPGMHTYLTYLAPCFRVKVGDYRNRNEALGMLKEANSMYDSPCMIVPDDITVYAY